MKCGAFARDGAKRKKGSKLHLHASVKDMAVDTLRHLLTLFVTPADEQDRKQVDALCEKVQEVTGNTVEVGYVDQGYTGEDAEG